MDICYALTLEVDGKINSVRLFHSRKVAYEQMHQNYFGMKNLNHLFKSIDSTNAIIITENTYIKWHIAEMEIE